MIISIQTPVQTSYYSDRVSDGCACSPDVHNEVGGSAGVFTFIYLLCVSAGKYHTHVEIRGQLLGVSCDFSSMWALGIKLRSSGLVVNDSQLSHHAGSG